MNAQNSLARETKAVAYTAAQIAGASRISKQSVLKSLAAIPAAEIAIVRGQETRAWTFDLFHKQITARVVQMAAQNGFSVADYLDNYLIPWCPAVALSEISESCLDNARKMRAALLPSLQRMDSKLLGAAERARLGLEDYKYAFGHEISERHWQRLIARTLRRDGGMEDFERLEIYLPENPARKSEAKRLLPGESNFKQLTDLIQSFADPNAPTRTEIAALWGQAFELYESGARTNGEQRRLRRRLVDFLFRHAPWLAKNGHALRVGFDRKYAKWIENEKSAAALLDGRELKRGEPTAKPIPPQDIDRLVWHAAANCGGRIAQAVREYADDGERSGLSGETVEIITRGHARKSHVNRRLASQLSGEVRGLMPFFGGKKSVDDATAHLDRDYSKLSAMQVVSADDFTFPVYFYVPDGNGWFALTRGQCLLMLDVRSWRVIAWSLQPERNYNSLVIRTLMNRVCGDLGIPGTWYFERGIWQNALLVKGNPPAGWENALSWPEAKIGWENLGVKFRHAIRARTKPVERVGGLLQDMMQGLRGYSGRDERRDCPEVTKLAMQEVQFRRVNHPGELFFSFDEWNEQLGQLIDRYNATSQDGKILQGLSPDEAFEKFWPVSNPPSRLDANCWHLVAHYVRPVPVTTNGICFRIGKKKFVYRNERTGQDRGKTVLAWFDPGSPDFLCITDANRKNPYLVERATEVDFLAEPGDPVFERELSKAAAHSAYPRARFHTLKARFAPAFRRNLVDAETTETAQQMTRLRTEKSAERREAGAQMRKASESFRRLHMPLPDRLRPGQADAARQLSELLQKDEETL